MKKTTLRDAARGFAKEWLLPKLGTAYAVYLLSGILFEHAKIAPDPNATMDPLLQLLQRAGHPYLYYSLVVLGVLLVLALLVKLYAKYSTPVGSWYRFSRAAPIFAMGVAVIAGTLLVPLALWLTSVVSFLKGPWYSNSSLWWCVGFCSLYVLVNFGLYFLTEDEKSDSIGALIWCLESNTGMSGKACTVLNEFSTELSWIGKAQMLASSNKGYQVIEIPLLYPAKKWPREDVEKFVGLYDGSGQALRKVGFTCNHIYLSDEAKYLIELGRNLVGKKVKKRR